MAQAPHLAWRGCRRDGRMLWMGGRGVTCGALCFSVNQRRAARRPPLTAGVAQGSRARELVAGLPGGS